MIVGEVEVDPESIVEAELPPKGIPLVLSVETAERKVAPKTNNTYISTKINVVDYPGATLYQSWFLTPNALAQRGLSR